MKILNEICANPKGNLFIGALANTFLYGDKNKLLNKIIKEALSDLTLNGPFIVIEQDGTIRAMQSTRDSATQYMNDDRILISCEACL